MRPKPRNRGGPKDVRKARETDTLAFLESVGQGDSPQALRLKETLAMQGDDRRDAHRQRQGDWERARGPKKPPGAKPLTKAELDWLRKYEESREVSK